METCRHPSRPPLFSSPMPPPPPPFHQTMTCPHTNSQNRSHRTNNITEQHPRWWRSWMKKYVILCLLCGGMSVLLGIIFIVIYFFLRSYTSSLQFFETIPTYVPAIVLIVTGLMVMCFAKRRNRFAYLIKLAGGCCLICALLCVVITVTTTVVHMNRLQMLHECVYTPKAKTCMCVSAIADPNSQDGAHRFVFNNTPNCEVVHGSLFACLRTLFGLSVIGILVCIFSSMLVFQLLTHEKKKVYFEQLEVRRRFLYRRYPHHGFCNCCEELYSWQLWDMLDYRLVNHHRPLSPSLETEENSPTSVNSSQTEGQHRNWRWFHWPWHRASRRAQREAAMQPMENSGGGRQRSFTGRHSCRDSWNMLSPTSPQDSPDAPVVSPWRNECVHIFRPNVRGAQALHFGIRSRGVNNYGRQWHRRTRSNDGVFHHLHLNPSARQPYTSTDGSSFLANYEIPRYMWGPPPPYSHPTSAENLAVLTESIVQENLRGRNNRGRPLELACLPTTLEMEVIPTHTVHSEKSTPISQRRLLCHDFTSESIRLTIGGNTPQNEMIMRDEHNLNRACIVEVHVPYIINKQDIVFNTLPTRSCKKKEMNPFKSLSNIPLCLSRRLQGFKPDKHVNGALSVIKSCFELQEVYEYPSDSLTNMQDVINIFCPNSSNKMLCSEMKSNDENSTNTSNTSNTSPLTETDPNSLRFPATILEFPSDFRSSIIIATSPSTPVTENVTLVDMFYAQSMPNLSVSNSPVLCSNHNTPSSGNTSTSQDFADFELEEDSTPIGMVSPECDVLSVKSLPDDNKLEMYIPETPPQFQSTCNTSPQISVSTHTCSCQYLTSDSSSSNCGQCSPPFQVDSDSSVSIVPRRFQPLNRFVHQGESSGSTSNSNSHSPGNSNDQFVITIKSINV